MGFLLERNEMAYLCQPPKRRGPASQGAGTWDEKLEDPEVDVCRQWRWVAGEHISSILVPDSPSAFLPLFFPDLHLELQAQRP